MVETELNSRQISVNAGVDLNTSDSLDQYHISEVDDAGDPAYYGYLDKTGKWYILQENVAAGTYRYANGTTGYVAAWAGRAALVYDLFNNVF